MHCLNIEIIYSEEYMLELMISISMSNINANLSCYTTNEALQELAGALDNHLKSGKPFSWEIGNEDFSLFKMEFSVANLRGYSNIKCIMIDNRKKDNDDSFSCIQSFDLEMGIVEQLHKGVRGLSCCDTNSFHIEIIT